MHDLNAKAIVLLFLLTAKESEKENAIEASLYPMLAKAISLYENGVYASKLWNLIKDVLIVHQIRGNLMNTF